jgi:hypothetical protein
MCGFYYRSASHAVTGNCASNQAYNIYKANHIGIGSPASADHVLTQLLSGTTAGICLVLCAIALGLFIGLWDNSSVQPTISS